MNSFQQGPGCLQHVCRHTDSLRRLHIMRDPRISHPVQGVGRLAGRGHRRRSVWLLHRRQRHLPAASLQGHEYLDEQPTEGQEGASVSTAVQRQLHRYPVNGV